jgi:peptidoglycan/LPS O-acetylase OafA/YrhL
VAVVLDIPIEEEPPVPDQLPEAGPVASARTSQGNYLTHLDGLRAVAVYLVVAFHAGLAGFSGGFVGVDIFFVLSGYLVTRILIRDLSAIGRIDLRNFYARRFRRILPAAAVVLLITAAAYVVVASPAERLDAVGGFRSAFLWSANWHFVSQATNYFAPSVTASPVLHFWSLAVEEQFYFVWPLLLTGLYLGCRRLGRHSGWVLRSIVAALAFASLLEALRVGSTNLDRAYYGTDTRAYQLLAGALLALTPQLFVFGARFARVARVAAGVTLAALVLSCSSAFVISPIERGVFAALLTCLLIVAVESSPTGVVRGKLSNSRLAYFGQISYGTYLWHWPLIILIAHDYRLAPIPLFLVVAIAATGLASLSYHVLEHPIRVTRGLDRFRMPVIATGLAVSVAAGLVLVPGILRWNTNGSANAPSLTVTALRSKSVRLLDWRTAETDIPALPDCLGKPVTKCTIVNGTGASVVIVGDSLARMWLPAFIAIARRESLTLSVAALPACPWQQHLTGLRISPGCTKHRADWYGRVIPRLRPSIVILAERGYDKPGNDFFVPGPHGQVLARSGQGEELLESASATSIRTLSAPHRKIVVLDATPLPPDPNFDPVSCLSTGSSDCSFRVSTALTSFDRFFQQEARRSFISNLDLDRLVCPRLPVCDPIVNNIIVRRDATHITATYARSLSDRIDALLHRQGILPPRSPKSLARQTVCVPCAFAKVFGIRAPT